MYISASRQRDTVIVWEQRTHTGGLKIRKFPAPYECYVEVKVIKALQAKLDVDTDNEDPKLEQFLTHVYNALTEPTKKHISMFDDRLFKLKFKDGGQWKAFLGSVPVEVRLWESDIPPELKVLSANYYKAANPRLNLTFYDIEVDYDPNRGFSSTMDPYAPINSIAFYHVWKKEYKVIAVPPKGWDGKIDYTLFKDVQHKYEIITVNTEAELLAYSVEEIQQTDVLSGYNSSLFDDPYFAQRVQMILGDEWFNRLSFPGGKPPYFKEVEIMFRMQKQVQFDGRICCDYLELFKKFTVEDRDSWNLESVSADHLGERFAKLDYEGTLNDLYNNNFSKFVRYNLRDTEILGELDKKYKFINSANTLIHQSTCHFRNIVGTVRTADLAITNYCWYELDRRVPDSRILAEQGQAAGAYVLVPQHGIKEWIVCFDINSLYPNTIRTIGISPETLVGQFAEFEAAWTAIYNQTTIPLSFKWEKTGVIETKPACEWREILLERKLSVSGYGTVFDQSREGIIPALLGRWYATRKEYQALAKQKQKEMEEITAQIAELEVTDLISRGEQLQSLKAKLAEVEAEYQFADMTQYVMKIKLNSLYGALLNQTFRFYDKRMGQSVTASGRMILCHQIRKGCEIIDGNYNIDPIVDDEDPRALRGEVASPSLIYGDTDSVVGDTQIYVNGSKQTIADFYNNCTGEYLRSDDVTQDYVKCVSGYTSIGFDGNAVVTRPINYVMKHKVKKRMFQVRVNGCVVQITADHSLIVRRGGAIVEIKPTEVIKGDKLISINTQPSVSP